jgi:hypothetical protein
MPADDKPGMRTAPVVRAVAIGSAIVVAVLAFYLMQSNKSPGPGAPPAPQTSTNPGSEVRPAPPAPIPTPAQKP